MDWRVRTARQKGGMRRRGGRSAEFGVVRKVRGGLRRSGWGIVASRKKETRLGGRRASSLQDLGRHFFVKII